MTRAERARDLFFEGCNCAQAVFLAFAEDRMDRDTALKIASGYGGGMAGMRGVCGAVNGMFMAYGLPVVADDAEGAVDMAVAERLTGDGRSVQAELL